MEVKLNFEEIYEKDKNLVFNLCLHYLQNIEDAEEVVQDVFVSVFENLDKFNFKSSISTWIYRIAINKSLSFIDKKKAKKRFGIFYSIFDNKLKYDNSDFNHPGVLLEQKEAMAMLFKHINTLNNNQKTVIILNKIEQKSINEVAEIMKISPKAVESLLTRAKVNLKQMGNY